MIIAYGELLQSDEWKEKRSQILTRDKYRCKMCNNNSLISELEKGVFTKNKQNPYFLNTAAIHAHILPLGEMLKALYIRVYYLSIRNNHYGTFD